MSQKYQDLLFDIGWKLPVKYDKTSHSSLYLCLYRPDKSHQVKDRRHRIIKHRNLRMWFCFSLCREWVIIKRCACSTLQKPKRGILSYKRSGLPERYVFLKLVAFFLKYSVPLRGHVELSSCLKEVPYKARREYMVTVFGYSLYLCRIAWNNKVYIDCRGIYL